MIKMRMRGAFKSVLLISDKSIGMNIKKLKRQKEIPEVFVVEPQRLL